MAVHPSIADIRKSYQKNSLTEETAAQDPVLQFEKWWEEALSAEVEEINAMTLATATPDGKPSARTVLLKSIQDDGFVFFTNYNSRKAAEIAANPFAALVFFWKELERQVRIEGRIEKVPGVESDNYFQSRPFESQIGAWASPQSSVIPSRKFLEDKEREALKQFEGNNIPRPDFWGGYVLIPASVEFWQGRPGRLHDRLLYTRQEGHWQIARLAP